jgi:rhodanese-related sulfurtransferase
MNDTQNGAPLPTIAVDDLTAHIARNDVFVLDLRGGRHDRQIYGAIRYDPAKLLDAPRLTLPLPQNSGLIVVYDEDGTSSNAIAIAQKLRDEGYGTVCTLEGGFRAYLDAAAKTEETTLEQPVPLAGEHQVER